MDDERMEGKGLQERSLEVVTSSAGGWTRELGGRKGDEAGEAGRRQVTEEFVVPYKDLRL